MDCHIGNYRLFYVKEYNWLENMGIRKYVFFLFNSSPSIVTSYMVLFLLNFDLNASFSKTISLYTFGLYLTQNISYYLLLGNSEKYEIKSSSLVLIHILQTTALSYVVNKLGLLRRKVCRKFINLLLKQTQ